MIKYTFIKQLREEAGFSQEKLAQELGMARVSYIAVEKGEKDITLSQADILSRMYGVSLDELQQGKRMTVSTSLGQNIQSKDGAMDSEPRERIIMSKENAQKFKEVLLYILEKVGNKPNVGMTVLYKLLYFIDFDYYEKYETQLIGAKYIKNTHGPTPVSFAKIVDSMKGDDIEEIVSQYFQYDQKKFLPRRRADLSILNGQEIAHIDAELSRLSDLTAVQISELSHKDTPWLMAKNKEQLDYEYVFYRPEETSVRKYEQL